MRSSSSWLVFVVLAACTGGKQVVPAPAPAPAPKIADHDETAGVVRVEVEYADEGHQAKIDEEYGAGVVVLESRLRSAPASLPRAGQPCTDGESLADGCDCRDRTCMDICCVGSACSHHSGPEGGWSKCIRLPGKK